MTARLAIVTGASRGIGSATARRVARDFTHVVLVARTPETLATTAAAVREAGAAALPIAADLRDTDAAGRVVGEALAWGGRIDALINIAGAVPQADLFDLTDAQWDDGLALKFHGARRLTLAAWHALRASGGSVVFTSGASADAPKPEFAAVGTINAAIVALAKAFSERGIRDGVQVNAMLPGPVMTDRRRAMIANYARINQLSPDQASDRFAADTRISRYGQPEEIAELAAFLVSPAAHWMTGAAVRMDGGEAKGV